MNYIAQFECVFNRAARCAKPSNSLSPNDYFKCITIDMLFCVYTKNKIKWSSAVIVSMSIVLIFNWTQNILKCFMLVGWQWYLTSTIKTLRTNTLSHMFYATRPNERLMTQRLSTKTQPLRSQTTLQSQIKRAAFPFSISTQVMY